MNDVVPPTTSKHELRDPGFLAGEGAVRALMRTHDWSTSSLGQPATWPQPLRSLVSLVLDSKFPMFVAWGEALGFLYNDAYSEILGGKHSAALGARFQDIWSEIWPNISPHVDRAMAGEATWQENLPLTMGRKGFDEPTRFTFFYSPARDESGSVAGLFCACTETTHQVVEERRQAFRIALDNALRDLADAREIMEAAAGLLGRQLGADRAGYAEIDEAGEFFTVERDWHAPGMPRLAGRHCQTASKTDPGSACNIDPFVSLDDAIALAPA